MHGEPQHKGFRRQSCFLSLARAAQPDDSETQHLQVLKGVMLFDCSLKHGEWGREKPFMSLVGFVRPLMVLCHSCSPAHTDMFSGCLCLNWGFDLQLPVSDGQTFLTRSPA